MPLVRIRAARALDARRLHLELTDGRAVDRDVGSLLRGPIFDAIRADDAEFARVAVEGGSVVWPNGADLDPDVLIWGGIAPE